MSNYCFLKRRSRIIAELYNRTKITNEDVKVLGWGKILHTLERTNFAKTLSWLFRAYVRGGSLVHTTITILVAVADRSSKSDETIGDSLHVRRTLQRKKICKESCELRNEGKANIVFRSHISKVSSPLNCSVKQINQVWTFICLTILNLYM